MIVDKIIKLILKTADEARVYGSQKPCEISVYVDVDTWREMMSELSGKLSVNAFEVYQSMGKKIMGFPIYKVLPAEGERPHGIKIFDEVKHGHRYSGLVSGVNPKEEIKHAGA